MQRTHKINKWGKIFLWIEVYYIQETSFKEFYRSKKYVGRHCQFCVVSNPRTHGYFKIQGINKY